MIKKPILLALLISVLAVQPFFAASLAVPVNTDASVYINSVKQTPERKLQAVYGRILVPARTIFGKFGIEVRWYQSWNRVELEKGDTCVTMMLGSMKYKVNNATLSMDTFPVLSDGTVMVPVRAVAEAFGIPVGWDNESKSVLLGILTPPPSRGDDDREGHTVVIDPGHGGTETGAQYGGISEKDLNLSIALKVRDLLQAKNVHVLMTRVDDRDVGLYDRSGMANQTKADLLLSIHNNANDDKSIRGTMSLYNPADTNSNGRLTGQIFAGIVQKNLLAALGTRDDGVIARPNLAVLRTSEVPAAIAEIAFMSNKDELAKLKTADFQAKAAKALTDAVLQALVYHK